MSTSQLTEAQLQQALEMLRNGSTMTDAYRATGVYYRKLKKLAGANGIDDTSQLVAATRKRIRYLEQRLAGLPGRPACAAAGISRGGATVYEHGRATPTSPDHTFTPAGPDAARYNGLMDTLTALKQAETQHRINTGETWRAQPVDVARIDPYRPAGQDAHRRRPWRLSTCCVRWGTWMRRRRLWRAGCSRTGRSRMPCTGSGT